MRLLVSFPDPDTSNAWLDALRAELPEFEVEAWTAQSAPAEYAVGWQAPPELFAAQHRLKAFFAAGAGVNDLLASERVPSTLPLVRVEDAGMGEQMADYCSGAVLHWFTHGDEYAGQQRHQVWRPRPPWLRADWTVGIFGGGALGQVVLERFASLGFPVRMCTRRPRTDARWPVFATGEGLGQLDAFLAGCRVVVIAAPLTAATRGLFDEANLGKLPRGAYVINVARGGLVVETDLLKLLDNGWLAGAKLDVFATEPLPVGHPLWRHPRVVVTPHASAYTLIGPSTRQIALKLRALEAGTPVSGLVDRRRGY